MSSNSRIPDASGDRVLSIAVIGPDEQRRSQVTRALSESRSAQIREFVAYPSSLDDASEMLKRSFDVVFVDLDSDQKSALELVERICVFGSAVVMVYAEKPDPDLLLRSMRAGAREFLPLPFSNNTMAEALARASARRPVTEPIQSKKPDGSLFVFLGSKGGAGSTTLACNFAVSLAQESGKNTLLVDLNLPLGDAAINLGIKSQFSTADALQNSSRLDRNFLSSMLVKHSSGLSVLAAPSELNPIQASNDSVDKLLAVARQDFEYVVVDAGSRLDLQRTVLFNESATLYLVTQVGIPELRNANRLTAQFSQGSGPKLEIVINRFESDSQGISEEQVTKALTRAPRWKIPNDYPAVRRMQNTATPLVLEDSPIARVIRQMSRLVCGKPEPTEKKKGFSFFR